MGTGFWRNNPQNNNIESFEIDGNVENRKNQTPTPWAEIYVLRDNVQKPTQLQQKTHEIPRYWDTAAEGEKVWNYVQQQEGDIKPRKQNKINYLYSLGAGLGNMYANYKLLTPVKISDKYKHAVINCEASQQGKGGFDMAKLLSFGKELKDVWTGQNTKDSSKSDNYANQIGRLLGTKYPNDNCQFIIQKYIDK